MSSIWATELSATNTSAIGVLPLGQEREDDDHRDARRQAVQDEARVQLRVGHEDVGQAEHHERCDEVVEDQHDARAASGRPERGTDLAEADVRHRRVHHREQADRDAEARCAFGDGRLERAAGDRLDRVDRWCQREVRDRQAFPIAIPIAMLNRTKNGSEPEVLESCQQLGCTHPRLSLGRPFGQVANLCQASLIQTAMSPADGTRP